MTAPTAIPAPPDAVRGSATVAVWTLLSRATGLGRIIVIGAVLGPTYLANCFVAANTVPNVVCLAMAGSVLGAVVVPAVIARLATDGKRSATELLGRLAGFLVLVTGIACVVLLLVSPLIAHLLTFDIANAAARDRSVRLVVMMVAFVAPQVLLYMIAALGAAAQQAMGRFALAAAAPAIENIGVMGTVVAVGLVYGTGYDVGDTPVGAVALLCVGSTLSVVLHAGLQIYGAARAGLPLRIRFSRHLDPLTGQVVQRLRGSVVVAASPHLSYFALIALAGTVPGGVLVLQMAYNVYSLPVAMGARAVGTAVLPGLSAAAHHRDRVAFNARAREGVAYAFIAGLLPLFVLLAFAAPVADVLANGRLRVGALIAALAGCLIVMAVAQLLGGLREVGVQCLFAGLDVRGPRIAAALALAVTILAGVASLVALHGSERLIGLSAALLAGDLVGGLVVLALLARVVRPASLVDGSLFGATGLAAAAAAPALGVGWLVLRGVDDGRVGNLLIAGVASTVAAAVYALVLYRTARRIAPC